MFTTAAPLLPSAFLFSPADFNSGKAALESHMHDIKFVSKTLANSSLSKSSALFRMLVPQLFTKISNSLQGSFPINSWHRRLREEFVSNDGKRSRMVSAVKRTPAYQKSESSTLIDTYWHHYANDTSKSIKSFKLGVAACTNQYVTHRRTCFWSLGIEQLSILCYQRAAKINSKLQKTQRFSSKFLSLTPFSVDKSATIAWQRSGANWRTTSSSFSPLAQIATWCPTRPKTELAVFFNERKGEVWKEQEAQGPKFNK